jgi:hypothetical protein
MKRAVSASAAAIVAAAVLATGGAVAGETKAFGKPLQGLAPASLDEILQKPEAGKHVRLEGEIQRVCSNKGCWLELKQGEQSVHVTFEGYSFFVPKDSAGKRAALEGKVVVKQPSADEVAHKKSEGAAAAGGKVSIEASGVLIGDPR